MSGSFQDLNVVNVLKFQIKVACQKVYTNSADSDQTASEEAVWSGSSVCYSDKHFVNFNPMTNILFNKRIKKFR